MTSNGDRLFRGRTYTRPNYTHFYFFKIYGLCISVGLSVCQTATQSPNFLIIQQFSSVYYKRLIFSFNCPRKVMEWWLTGRKRVKMIHTIIYIHPRKGCQITKNILIFPSSYLFENCAYISLLDHLDDELHDIQLFINPLQQ